jgi:hypothetical protein
MGSSLRPAPNSRNPRKRTGGASNLIGDGVASASWAASCVPSLSRSAALLQPNGASGLPAGAISTSQAPHHAGIC